ncbi:hypothetical protein DPEC_G00297500 [Dallia pectoralis]|uniref:Uncharacterized protein n=1 Tax=Dallia pectoralis TaxID=75939 RepID=A0ACC2FFN7_DALPE|nr:hypothetical protein DPEC_G00297500 [Dallia pectoralis]
MTNNAVIQRTKQPDSSGSDSSWRRPVLVVAVCLGLLYVLVLAGIIGIYVQNVQSNEALESRIAALESYNVNQTIRNTVSQVAFTAALGNTGYIGPVGYDTNLVFDEVITNIGGAYNSKTGVFTAPVRGVYFFMFTGHSLSDTNMGVSLVRNGNIIICKTFTQSGVFPSRHETASNSVTQTLEVGDQVNNVLWANTMINKHPNRYTTFVGQLLFLL